MQFWGGLFAHWYIQILVCTNSFMCSVIHHTPIKACTKLLRLVMSNMITWEKIATYVSLRNKPMQILGKFGVTDYIKNVLLLFVHDVHI